MHRRSSAVTAALAATALLLSACADDGTDESIGLEPSGSDDAPVAPEADDATDETDGRGDDAGDGDTSDDGDDAEADGSTSSGEVVDGTEAVPGTWTVGDAGTVTFDLVDGALVLEDVSENDGWTVTDVEESSDELEVDFQRDNVEIVIEIELTSGGSILEIEIDTDVDPAEPGTFEIGDAGSFSFEVADGVLELTDLTVADGWEIVKQDVDDDEIEIELRNGAMRWDIDVDLDDGEVEVHLDYDVTGQI